MVKRKTENDVELQEKTFKTLPEGFYCFALTGTETKQTKATQDMILLGLAPCTEEGKTKTADLTYASSFMILGNEWTDDETFREAKRLKLADKHQCKPSDVTAEALDAALKTAENMADENMYQAARAVFGAGALPPIPRYDPETKKFTDASGEVVSAEDFRAAKRAAIAAGVDKMADIVEGKEDVASGGFFVYGRVEHETFNDRTFARVRSIYERLPDGAELVPPSDWASNKAGVPL